MLISELSKRSGISIPTLRYYENFGLFKGYSDESVKTNNYKDYDESLLEKITLIKEAKTAGFTLSEIKKLLESWFDRRLSVEQKIDIVSIKIKEIEEKMRQLRTVKKLLADCIIDIRNGDC
ncbi:MerR family transcriptional regulator [Sphingobacterium paludis]|uniref:DNA-binding transcriptional MerR regulator n=1 Tax=Sphingobacterium paludis TaxID=1476465 RepID=A0A4R7CR62_9SPHI|nr:MerR family transcriptional regulator [Sphingobacterium paludis]TDS05548.1 DNA-binding transcriptional MerR regulator [Sphingobacterium paludis]